MGSPSASPSRGEAVGCVSWVGTKKGALTSGWPYVAGYGPCCGEGLVQSSVALIRRGSTEGFRSEGQLGGSSAKREAGFVIDAGARAARSKD